MFTRRKRGTLGQELKHTVAVWMTQVGLVGAVWGFSSLFTPASAQKAVAGGWAPMVATLPPVMAAVLTLSGPLLFLAGYFLKKRVAK